MAFLENIESHDGLEVYVQAGNSTSKSRALSLSFDSPTNDVTVWLDRDTALQLTTALLKGVNYVDQE
jgi:hypothetical protein